MRNAEGEGLPHAVRQQAAALYLELGLTSLAAHRPVAAALPGLWDTEGDTQADGFTRLAAVAARALASDVAWQQRAGFHGVLILARLAQLTDARAAWSALENVRNGDERIAATTRQAVQALVGRADGTRPGSFGSALPLALAAIDLQRALHEQMRSTLLVPYVPTWMLGKEPREWLRLLASCIAPAADSRNEQADAFRTELEALQEA